MKKNFVKILTMLCCMVALVAMIALPCFADITDAITIDVSKLPSSYYDYTKPVLTLPTYTNYTIVVDGEEVFTGIIESVSYLDSYSTAEYYLNDENGNNIKITFGSSENISTYIPFLRYNEENVSTVTIIAEGIEYDAEYPFVNGTGGDPVFNGITGVFSNISAFVVSSLGMVQGVFYDGTNLTMLGTLAVIGVAVAVAFLIIGVIQSFLKLRG